ncbi:hypothetical protein Moror_8128 [Moniliophthora roreri MCA 2997]|uniref:Uncharacterized protein n=2 Tax=Moniliophthora roreri TaxID=221103 RepID=V2XPJ2_MONRO|nr:hypothetical protein Moror_8128 [Moniliophthora roreri MCA 2997]
MVLLALHFRPVLAQAPANDIVTWPPGLLLLASVLYAALGTSAEELWKIDPAVGPVLCFGIPMVSIPTMQHVNWVSNTCHFIPRIRASYGQSNFWIPSEKVSRQAREDALQMALRVMHCFIRRTQSVDDSMWKVSSAGLVTPITRPNSTSQGTGRRSPSARDFLLFAATDYHVFRNWEVKISVKGRLVFTTKSMPSKSIVDVDSEQSALYVVAAHMVRRPYSQSPFIHNLAKHQGDGELDPWTLDLDHVDLDAPACTIDFHSYAPVGSKVSASLRELAGAYYRVVGDIKRLSETPQWSLQPGELATVSVGQTLWIAVLGGVLLDHGRLTVQNLPGRWGVGGVSADEAYINRMAAILEIIRPYANIEPGFDTVAFSSGETRFTAIPFFIAGVLGQMIICYFLTVGTSAGIWTSVAISNTLFTGRLTDLHSLYTGKTADIALQPGMKLFLPDSPSKQFMAIATFSRSAPQEGRLRPGLVLNLSGAAAAIIGSIFQTKTREALGFGSFRPTPDWVVYTAAGLAMTASTLVLSILLFQQLQERTWWKNSETPTRWMIYSTIPTSCFAAGLAVFFMRCRITRFWPILDVFIWFSGLPLAMLENGRMFSADSSMLHLVLLNRWAMGAIASSVGSARANEIGFCF